LLEYRQCWLRNAPSSAGYPWTLIDVERRSGYMAALESASAQQDIEPFARFIADRVPCCLGRTKVRSLISACRSTVDRACRYATKTPFRWRWWDPTFGVVAGVFILTVRKTHVFVLALRW
jgi:hypothetical protein